VKSGTHFIRQAKRGLAVRGNAVKDFGSGNWGFQESWNMK
jgi:hypothetical protein